MQPRLKRQRPLARACPQLLLDLAALLSGLRPLIMLDYAAGVTPAQLTQVLQPLPQLLPQFQGEGSKGCERLQLCEPGRFIADDLLLAACCETVTTCCVALKQ
jgi:hypothetical protein